MSQQICSFSPLADDCISKLFSSNVSTFFHDENLGGGGGSSSSSSSSGGGSSSFLLFSCYRKNVFIHYERINTTVHISNA